MAPVKRAADVAAELLADPSKTEPGELIAGPVLTCLADVEARPVAWLWPGRVSLGRITLLVGRPGEGKSFLSLDLAARVTTGGPWPDGRSRAPEGSVILVSAEDDPADTIRPRLDGQKGNAGRVHLLIGKRRPDADGRPHDVMFTLSDTVELEATLRRYTDCKLIVIDPIGSFLGGRVDGYRDNEVRSVLAPVAALAAKHAVAVLVLAHRRKSAGKFADDLALGSVAFTGASRSVLHLTRDPHDKARRLLLPGKSNLSPEAAGLAFTIGGEPPRLQWESNPVLMTADEALALENGGGKRRPGPKPAARNNAVEWLRELLADGPMEVRDIRTEAEAAGHSWRTVERAMQELGVRSRRERFGGPWSWELLSRQVPEDQNNLASWRDRADGTENGDSVGGTLLSRQVVEPGGNGNGRPDSI